jgi:3' terminal RNA ribose 2'-O-methyltransferase Hen1
MSVAIAKVFGSAMQGKCKNRPDLVDVALPLKVQLSVLPCRGGKEFLKQLFEPLGYQVNAKSYTLDSSFKEWGDSVYYTVELKKVSKLKDVLTHLYVLIPVLDNNKHYYVGEAELENLLARGNGWLSEHPQKETIARRYLKHRVSLARQALTRLMDDNHAGVEQKMTASDTLEVALEKPLSLNEQRIKAVLSKISDSGAKSILDLGCGEGKLLRDLINDKSIERIAGMDVSIRSLEIAHKRIGLNRLPTRIKDKISLFHGSLMYKDKRFSGFDAAIVMEVVEHLDPPRLAAFEKVLFKHAKPKTIIITTPNREYNAMWDNFPEGAMRHNDHRFEWTRDEFREWAGSLAEQYNYSIAYYTIGPESLSFGSPTQMGVFKRAD